MKLEDAKEIIYRNEWKRAKDQRHKHSYLWHTKSKTQQEFRDLEQFIWKNGVEGRWFQQRYIYLIIGEEMFWTISSPLIMPYEQALKVSQIINRASIWNMSGWNIVRHNRTSYHHVMPLDFVSSEICRNLITSSEKYIGAYRVYLNDGNAFFIDSQNLVIGINEKILINHVEKS